MSPSSMSTEADQLNKNAVHLQAQGRFNDALTAFQQAAAMYAGIQDRLGEARCVSGAGAVYKDLGRYPEAREWLERAIPLRLEVGDVRGELITRLTLGPVYQALGLNQRASETLERALTVAGYVGDLGLTGQVFYNLGVVAVETGRYSEALDWYRRSLDAATETSNNTEVNKCLNALGCTCAELAHYDEALQYFEATRTLSSQLGNRLGSAAAIENLAGLYRTLGQPEQAIPLIEEALQILVEENAVPLIPTAADLYGLLLLDASRFEDAKRQFEFAQRTSRKYGNRSAEAFALQHLGLVLTRMGRFELAAPVLEECVSLCHASGNRGGEGGALAAFAVLEHDRKDFQKAVVLAEQAVKIFRTTGSEWSAAINLFNLAASHDELGNTAIAFEYFEAAISAFDGLRYHVTGDELRTSFFDSFSVQNAYYVYVSRLLREYHTKGDRAAAAQAFLVSERRHARALLDTVDDGETTEDAATCVLHHAGPWPLTEIQDRLLDSDTLLLEYSLNQDAAYLFAVLKDRFEVFVLPEGSLILQKAEALRELARAATPTRFAAASHELYNMILAPAAEMLQGKKLLIVPDGQLHNLPFQMLVTESRGGTGPGCSQDSREPESEAERSFWPLISRPDRSDNWGEIRFLVRQTTMTYAPSATIAALLTRRPAAPRTLPSTFIGFAPLHSAAASGRGIRFGALPQTRPEIEKIGALFCENAVLLLGSDATKAAVLSRKLDGFRYIHFATHGIVNAAQPAASALALHPGDGTDGMLSAAEIMKLRLRADVVGLSACQTALGRARLGEGVIGLARAFLYAGARSVCASVWEVADAATAGLMTNYYRNLVDRGMESAQALRAAQLELMDSHKYGAPYYWAPFILVGGA